LCRTLGPGASYVRCRVYGQPGLAIRKEAGSRLREGSLTTLTGASHRLSFSIAPPVVRVLDLHPAAIIGPVETRVALRHDALEAELADRGEERLSVVEPLACRPGWAVQAEALELLSALEVRLDG
jgi:hypothetical protein